MLIELYDQTNDKGEAILIIRFCHCKNNEVYRVEINKTQTRAINKKKIDAVDEFIENQKGLRRFERKEVLKAFAKVDKAVAEYYKKEYPKGGKRENSGRKYGSYQDGKKSERTERFTQAITKKENEFLKEVLTYYRTDQEKIQKALQPFIKQIEAKFGDNIEALEKWRKRMANTNPAMLIYTLEHFALWGVEDLIPIGLKQNKKN